MASFALFSLLNAPVSRKPGRAWCFFFLHARNLTHREKVANAIIPPIRSKLWLRRPITRCQMRCEDVQKRFLHGCRGSLWHWGLRALSARCDWLMWDRAGWDDGFPSQTTNSQLCVHCKWSGLQPVCDVSAVVAQPRFAQALHAHQPVDFLAWLLLLFPASGQKTWCIFGTTLLRICVFSQNHVRFFGPMLLNTSCSKEALMT